MVTRLPFPPSPKWPQQSRRLPPDAPSILIVLLDDGGFGVAEAYAERRSFPFNGTIHTVKVAMGPAGDTGMRRP